MSRRLHCSILLHAKLVQQSGLRGSDLVTGLKDIYRLKHFDLTLGNLGGDVEDLEEGGLRGLKTRETGGDGDLENNSVSSKIHKK